MRALVFRCPVHGMFSVDLDSTGKLGIPSEWLCDSTSWGAAGLDGECATREAVEDALREKHIDLLVFIGIYAGCLGVWLAIAFRVKRNARRRREAARVERMEREDAAWRTWCAGVGKALRDGSSPPPWLGPQ